MANVTGFSIHVPQVQTTQYEISGADCQVLTVTLAPGQSVESEPGTMMFMVWTVLDASKVHVLTMFTHFRTGKRNTLAFEMRGMHAHVCWRIDVRGALP
jgi:uncharacterized protein (AIM24 family)